ncbi:4-hydroxythreonine-4-phosphate dehydrogenase PdxA [Desulfoluna butyratoxydans]|uniref:4-hydroxythreonine-4-phosphate dehydrogenase n=1 Tax=Desulfoluna butyratoxydans TaxID=231438 RepID=A0A4U8YMY6_9BACT|nr:4-hydroxythreonine-4-phosphate dehydrogenase PdxA [Desulfoluna butyratoxydans]VFQ42573.1 pyridoxal phosphate biosynthetic protein pdxa [Desulfoluna butyratoxydans]
MTQLPLLALTMGDPCGIGPEIAAKAFHSPKAHENMRPLLVGDEATMARAVETTGVPLTIRTVSSVSEARFTPGTMDLLPVSSLAPDEVVPGAPTARTGQAMIDAITRSVDLALSGECDAMVTGPIHKVAMKLAGSEFHGHTELIASRTRATEFAMMMAGDRLKVVLVTIHIPLQEVVRQLTPAKITDLISLTARSLTERFGVESPRIGVAGLNPHAGEEGLFGDEESRLIAPAVETARALHPECAISDPLPPDTVFFKAAEGHYDAVVCMYHDQGLIPFKMVHFHDGVNTTLGLPIIRTSVDHGTAYDIAWKNIASEGSLLSAMHMAAMQARNRIRR